MLSRSVDFAAVAVLAEEFGMEAGRRVFGVCLKVCCVFCGFCFVFFFLGSVWFWFSQMLLKQKRRVEMKNDSFELLLYLINRSLMSMNLASASDFITGRVFLKRFFAFIFMFEDSFTVFCFRKARTRSFARLRTAKKILFSTIFGIILSGTRPSFGRKTFGQRK